MQQKKVISSNVMSLSLILDAASKTDTIDEILSAIERRDGIRTVAMFVSDPSLSAKENDARKVACTRKSYDIAKFEAVREVYKQWKVAGVDGDNYEDNMKAVFARLKRVSDDPVAYIRGYFKASPSTHEFLWEHGDNGFKSFFPFVRKEVELPPEVKMIAKYFDATTYYPHYDIDIYFDRRRIFVKDRFGEHDVEQAKARAEKIKKWASEKPLKLW